MLTDQNVPGQLVPGKRQMLVNTGSAWLFKITSMLASLAITAIAVREYGLDGMGLILLATQIASYAGLVELGIPTSLSRRLPGLLAQHQLDEAYRLCASCLLILVFSAILGLSLVPIALISLPHVFAIPAEQKHVAGILFALAIGSIALQMPLRLGYGMLSSVHRFASYFNIEASALTIKVAAISGCLYFFDPPLPIYMLLTVVPSLAAAVLQYRLGRNVLPQWRFSFRQISRTSIVELLSLSLAVMAGTLASALVLYGGGLALAVFSTPQIVTEFSLPSILAFNLISFAASASAFISPIASQLAGRNDRRLAANVMISSRYSALVAAAILVGVVAVGRPLLQLWVGAEASPVALERMFHVLVIASLGGLLSTPGVTARGALVAIGKHWQVARVELITGLSGLSTGVASAIFLDADPTLSLATMFCLANFARGVLLARMFSRIDAYQGSFYWSNLGLTVLPVFAGLGTALSIASLWRSDIVAGAMTAAAAGSVFILVALLTSVVPAHRRQLLARARSLLSLP